MNLVSLRRIALRLSGKVIPFRRKSDDPGPGFYAFYLPFYDKEGVHDSSIFSIQSLEDVSLKEAAKDYKNRLFKNLQKEWTEAYGDRDVNDVLTNAKCINNKCEYTPCFCGGAPSEVQDHESGFKAWAKDNS